MRVIHTALMMVVGTGAITACMPSPSAPKRELGLSVFMFPKRAADLDASKTVKWGFAVTEREDRRRPVDRPTFQTAEDLLAFFRSRSNPVQQNGLWVVVTHPDAYSPEEKAILEHLESICVKQHVTLFVSRAFELPNGWKRVS